MKIYLKFDHSQEDTLKAIGCEYGAEQTSERIFDIIQRYMLDDSLNKASELSEMIHKKLEYEEILFLATKSVEIKMHRMMMEMAKDELDRSLDL
jgi:hypothetical protein